MDGDLGWPDREAYGARHLAQAVRHECCNLVLQEKYNNAVAVGKLAAAFKEGSPDPRLVGDSSVCNSSPQAVFPERIRHPSGKSVQACMTRHRLSHACFRLICIIVDISAAHKRIKLHPEESGTSARPCFSMPHASVTCFWQA